MPDYTNSTQYLRRVVPFSIVGHLSRFAPHTSTRKAETRRDKYCAGSPPETVKLRAVSRSAFFAQGGTVEAAERGYRATRHDIQFPNQQFGGRSTGQNQRAEVEA